MPRKYSVCTHPERGKIAAQLAGQIADRTIADRFSVSKTALIRHAGEHLPAHLAKAEHAREVAAATDIMAEQQRCLRASTCSSTPATAGSATLTTPPATTSVRGQRT